MSLWTEYQEIETDKWLRPYYVEWLEKLVESLRTRLAKKDAEIERLKRNQRPASLDEALNSGDGVYRP